MDAYLHTHPKLSDGRLGSDFNYSIFTLLDTIQTYIREKSKDYFRSGILSQGRSFNPQALFTSAESSVSGVSGLS